MTSSDLYLILLFGALVVVLSLFLLLAVRRGSKTVDVNVRIEANQRAMIALTERQVLALERIAAVLEKR